jgi:Fe-S oxidoreductase
VLEEETLQRLYQAGIRTITTGVETNDAACMESIGQRITINARLGDRVRFCQSVGFRLYGTYCLGMPEETWETVEKTWRFANELDIESGFTVLTPFPARRCTGARSPRDCCRERCNSRTGTAIPRRSGAMR